jgi:hypothetical protein
MSLETRTCRWRQTGNEWHLLIVRRVIARVAPDARWPKTNRVVVADGFVSDLVNLTRAKDAALSLAMVKRKPPRRRRKPHRAERQTRYPRSRLSRNAPAAEREHACPPRGWL